MQNCLWETGALIVDLVRAVKSTNEYIVLQFEALLILIASCTWRRLFVQKARFFEVKKKLDEYNLPYNYLT